METSNRSDEFDVIVIGSGMGGMTTAAALSRFDHKVLLLEQAQMIGGLTHAFSRNRFSWDVGLHYCGSFGPDQFAGLFGKFGASRSGMWKLRFLQKL